MILLAVSSTTNLKAREYNNLLTIDDIELVSETVLKDKNSNDFYFFDTKEDLEGFMSALMQAENDISLYTCLPGDPGYPNCSDQTIIRVEEEKISTSAASGWLNSNYLLDSWVNGGSYGASMTLSKSQSVSFSYNGLSISFMSGTSQTFNVPAGKMGNIVYQARFVTETYQIWNILKNGTRQKGATVRRLVEIDSRFSGVYRNS